MSDYTSTYMQMLTESTRASSGEAQFIPFDQIKPGMIARDYADEKSVVIATGTWRNLRKYDTSGVMESEIEAGNVNPEDEMLAVRLLSDGDDGDPIVYVHGGDGGEVYVEDNRPRHSMRRMSEHHENDADVAGADEVPGFSEELLAVPVGKVLDLLSSRVASNEEDEELKSLYEKLEAFLTEASGELVPKVEDSEELDQDSGAIDDEVPPVDADTTSDHLEDE